MKFYDADRFELEFEDDISIEERDYYCQLFKNVNSVAHERNHCTTCNIHIGSSPSIEYNLKMHSVLRVTQCGKCYSFYNSGAFVKGDDGNEIHCRWCGQGGELYCCSACPYAFCQKCIVRNLTADALILVLTNDDWKCYVCEPKVLYPLRAQHWALFNFIKKQLKALEIKMSKGLRDQDAIAFHMKKDLSICCPSKTTVGKRKLSITYDDNDVDDDDVDDDDDDVDDDDEPWRETSEKSRSSNRLRKKVEVVVNERSRREIRKSRTYEPSVSAKISKAKPNPPNKSISKATSTTTAISRHARTLNGGETNAASASTMTPDVQAKSSFTNAIEQPTEPIGCPSISVGRGRTQLQSQMFKAMQMCRQVDEKLIELMHSKTYKTANSMNDIKEVYTCLSHLLTYADDQVQYLQGTCIDDMRQFGFETDAIDATDATKENHHPLDENEIVEFPIKMDPDDKVDSINDSETTIDELTSEFIIKDEPAEPC